MKILFISDIHANFPALEAVWKKEHDSDMILCAGDLVDWGFYPKEVIQWCREQNVAAVAGNHDRDICRIYHAVSRGNAGPDGTIAMQNISQLHEEDIAWLDALPEERTLTADGTAYYIKHFYKEEEDNRNALLGRWIHYEAKAAFDEFWPNDLEAATKVIMTGHSHQCYLYQAYAGAFFLNPGSISYRVCTDSRAKGADYAVLQDGEFRLRHVDYDRSVFIPFIENTPLHDHVREAVSNHLVKELP